MLKLSVSFYQKSPQEVAVERGHKKIAESLRRAAMIDVSIGSYHTGSRASIQFDILCCKSCELRNSRNIFKDLLVQATLAVNFLRPKASLTNNLCPIPFLFS